MSELNEPTPEPNTRELASRLEDLSKQLEQARQDIEMLVTTGQWVVWSATVCQIGGNPLNMHWRYRPDFCLVLPPWLNVHRGEGDDFNAIMDRARIASDSDECDHTAHNALISGAPGYTQLFRVRMRDGRISWVEENVAIKRLPGGGYQLVGVCIDATQRKEAEEETQRLQEELVAQQEELIAQQDELLQQNEELHILRETLERDKAALAEANARLESLATTDGLTGIKNHRAFQEQLDREWQMAERYGTSLSLVMLDLDHFKEYNDAFGHPAGDEVLKGVGQALREAARANDCIARYGGEEFAVILPQTDSEGAMNLAERLRAAIETSQWQSHPMTASIGVATKSPLIDSPRALISSADRALYGAKSSGRNRVYHASDRPKKRAA